MIDTTDREEAIIGLKDSGKIVAQKKFNAARAQAEKLLPEIDKLLLKKAIKLNDLTGIEVNNIGSSFTSLRIGVITANTLGFALGIPVTPFNAKTKKMDKFSIVPPIYDREPV